MARLSKLEKAGVVRMPSQEQFRNTASLDRYHTLSRTGEMLIGMSNLLAGVCQDG